MTSEVPFCSLPDHLRTLVHDGFREGRSPDVLGVTGDTVIVGGTGPAAKSPATPWPSAAAIAGTAVPLAFAGAGVTGGTSLPAGVTLDQVAPTVADILGFDRPHPEVRSGDTLEGVATGATQPRLVVQVIWKGVGDRDLERDAGAWPELEKLSSEGAATTNAGTGSLPVDPAASLATIGTGGLPYQHGIVSSVVTNDRGQLVRAWGPGAPVSVIATLSDDLDDHFHQRASIGLVGTDGTDRGAIGGNWYIDADEDDVSIVPPQKVAGAAVKMLGSGYGGDEVPDVLTVVDDGPLERMDADLARIRTAAERAAPGATTYVVTATGSLATSGQRATASDVNREVEDAVPGADPVVLAAAPGGLYLDQRSLAKNHIDDDVIIEALQRAKAAGGERLMDQVFPAIAVSFSRYC